MARASAIEIKLMIAEGKTEREIADELGITVGTVKDLKRRYGLRNNRSRQ